MWWATAAPYLTENMDVQLQLFEGNAISIEIPQRATFEMVETEPVMKGQTASGSFKPALLSNGVQHHGADPHRRRHPRGGDDGRRLVCRTGERLSHAEAHRSQRSACAYRHFLSAAL